MLSPTSKTFSLSAGSQPKPTNHKGKPKSYAQVAASASSSIVSLLHTDLNETSQNDTENTVQQCMVLARKQHPNAHACIPLSDGSKRYLEIYIE
jgi:hypothetical protein